MSDYQPMQEMELVVLLWQQRKNVLHIEQMVFEKSQETHYDFCTSTDVWFENKKKKTSDNY